jgi:superfamily II DNA or RNA helicase/HKD family nuclease
MGGLTSGIYDHLISEKLRIALDSLDSSVSCAYFDKLEEPLSTDYLTRFLRARIHQALSVVKHDQRLDLANQLLNSLAEFDKDLTFLSSEKIENLTEILNEISPLNREKFLRPTTSPSSPSLFTGTGTSPQLGRELELELESADRVDMLVSFIKSAGLKLLLPYLKNFTDRGGKLRVITTTYLGASDPIAIRLISDLPNTEIKINYDTKHSRLHAKAYFIHRDTGLSCAFIGSANLSHAAMTSGLEWTVKLPATELPDLFRRCEAEFSSYWENPSFVKFTASDFTKLVAATKHEKGAFTDQSTILTVFKIQPFDYQNAILENLQLARDSRNHFRNLVIAATGTGKTMIAAFDYKRSYENGKKKLIFLAHRKEILEQARATFRQVIQDGNFGEFLFDNHQPENHDHLFCTVASFHSRNLIDRFGASHWDMVILDEAHHGIASTYRPILEDLKPKILLGLTATPERADGTTIADDFDMPVAGEIRLPDALEQKLLCPFHYYAISDHTTDLSAVEWKRGRYDTTEIENLISGNQLRAQLVIDKIVEHLPDPCNSDDFERDHVKGLGFCVSKSHAAFMASAFKKAGIPAIAIDSDTPSEERRLARQRLQKGDINFIFTVDLFNEGVDIPATNCLLFLRPTESHVLYLQQFGRGLRHSDGKDQVIVLDFIPRSRREFRFDLRFTSLLPGKRKDIISEVETGFPHLPSGCHIQLERQAREEILKNIKDTYRNPEFRIKESFRKWSGGPPPTFYNFILETGENPIDLLLKRSWSEWKKIGAFDVETANQPVCPDLRALARLSEVTSQSYLLALGSFLVDPTDSNLHPLAASAHYLYWTKSPKDLGFSSYAESFAAIRKNHPYMNDALEIIAYSKHLSVSQQPVSLPFNCPLSLHGTYGMREVSAAFGKANLESSGPTGTGVISVKEYKLYLHFVTFEKSEKHFSESTMYRDYPISPTRLHWESQSNTSQDTPTGQNYIHHQQRGYTILFFARVRRANGKLTSAFTYLGPAKFISATGDRPIAIEWELIHPMPAEFYHECKLASGF